MYLDDIRLDLFQITFHLTPHLRNTLLHVQYSTPKDQSIMNTIYKVHNASEDGFPVTLMSYGKERIPLCKPEPAVF